MKNALLKEIETAGRNQEGYRKTAIMKSLHALNGINFNKPLFVEKINEKFTVNQIEKALNAAGLDTFTSNVFLVIKPRKIYRNNLHLATLEGGQLVYNMREKYRTRKHAGYYNITCNLDYFYRRADIEEARKNCEYAYIIAQKKEYATPTKEEETPNATTRYELKEAYNNGILTKNPETGNKIEYNAPHKYGETKTASDIIDKSGYIIDIKRNELEKKAAALKAEREKAAYLKTNNAGRIDALDALTKEAKAILIKQIENAGNYDEMHEAERTADRVKWAVYYLDRLKTREKNREYKSIEDFNEAAEKVKKELEKVTKGEKEE